MMLPKHGARTLRRRQKNRPARRARLANTWSRAMAMVDHPLAAMAKLAPDTMHPKLTGPARKRWARRWARNRLKKLRAAGKPYICGVCGGDGHNARTCKKLPAALASGEITLRKARALFGVTGLVGGAR